MGVSRGNALVKTQRVLLSVLVALGAMASNACAAHHHSAAFDQGDDAGEGGASEGVLPDGGWCAPGSGDSGTFGDGGATTPDPGVSAECPSGIELVFVATEERRLYSIDPKNATFTLLGLVDCAGGQYVNSMAIDRAGNAWINYGDGSLWKSPTQNPTCVSTGFIPLQSGVSLFGMGFTAKTSGATSETLYIDDLAGGGLGYIDPSSMSLLRASAPSRATSSIATASSRAPPTRASSASSPAATSATAALRR